MGKEIERKFLLKDDSFMEMATTSYDIRQGYLSKDVERTVRVRIKGDKGYLTIKGKTENIERLEFEYEIPVDEARQLLELALPGEIEKQRYIVPFQGFKWEVDIFHGRLEGLKIAEIELPSSETVFTLPPFVDREVSDDPAYYNSNL